MKTSDSIDQLAAALTNAQGAMKNAPKDSANPFFKSKYADLATCWDTIRLPLSACGLSVAQTAGMDEQQRLTVTTRLMHKSGQWIEGTIHGTPKDSTPQAMGSAITYLRRYSLAAIVGLASEDDDGAAASGTGVGAAAEPRPARRPPGTISKKETKADVERIAAEKKAELEQFGVDAFQPDEPRKAASKKSEAMAFIRNMVDPADANRCRAAIVEHVANGHMTDGEAIECETAIIDRLRVLAFPTKEEIAEAEKDKVAF